MKIGIAISGGGYRATTYSLGVFSYLNHLQLDGKPLLQHVEALSTVSGGSITGITYAQSVKEGEPFKEYFKRMHTFISTYDLVSDSVNYFVSDSTNTNSLIEGFAKTYAHQLLKGKTFESIIPKEIQTTKIKNEKNETVEISYYDSHLKYTCINATDFNTGSPFRFVAVADHCKYQPDFGNGFYSLNKEKIKNIPLEIPLAASSCFPGGFEPIILKLDQGLLDTSSFSQKLSHLEHELELLEQQTIDENDHAKIYEKEQLKLQIEQTNQIIKNKKCIALMDGGIMDNQGIDALLDYEKSKEDLDLLLVVDVSSPSFDKYKAVEECKVPVIGNVKMIQLLYLTMIFNCVCLALVIYAYIKNFNTLLIISTVFFTVFSLSSVALILGKIAFKSIVNSSKLNFGKLKVLNLLTPNAVMQLVKNRFTSVGLLVQSVFMKQLRRKNFEEMYQVFSLSNKRMVNQIYLLKSENKLHEQLKFGKITLPEDFAQPTYLMRQICDKAYAMGTTLWVDSSQEGQDLIVNVLVAGQITTCANLLDHYSKLEKSIKKHESDNKIDSSYHSKVKAFTTGKKLYELAQRDWSIFVKNPYWLVEYYGINVSKELKQKIQ